MNMLKKFRSFLIVFGVFCCFGLKPESSLVGKPAPLFTAKCVDLDGKERPFDLSKYKGKMVVLYFYPMDDTPGCTKQAQNFRDAIEKLRSKGVILFGISCDSIKSHKAFQKKHNLPFALISDSRLKHTIAKKYSVKTFLVMWQRKTVLINQQGIVIKVFDDVNIATQVDDILKAYGF